MTIYSFSVFKIYTTAKALLLLDEIFIGCPYSTKESSPKKHKRKKVRRVPQPSITLSASSFYIDLKDFELDCPALQQSRKFIGEKMK